MHDDDLLVSADPMTADEDPRTEQVRRDGLLAALEGDHRGVVRDARGEAEGDRVGGVRDPRLTQRTSVPSAFSLWQSRLPPFGQSLDSVRRLTMGFAIRGYFHLGGFGLNARGRKVAYGGRLGRFLIALDSHASIILLSAASPITG